MKAISWASGVELNYTKKRLRFLSRLQTFFYFCHVFFTFLTFLNFYLNVFLHLWFTFCTGRVSVPERTWSAADDLEMPQCHPVVLELQTSAVHWSAFVNVVTAESHSI